MKTMTSATKKAKKAANTRAKWTPTRRKKLLGENLLTMIVR